jgi:hypothetical protein
VRSTPATLREATPFIEQVRALVSERELRGLVADLRPTIPELAELAQRSIGFMEQARRVASCFNEVIIPWGYDTVDPPDNYPLGTIGRVFETTGYGLVAIGGESRSGDANGQYIRVLGGGGTNTVAIPPDPTVGRPEQVVGVTPYPITGSLPSFQPFEDSNKTKFKPKKPCERQEPPDLGATIGIAPEQSTTSAPTPAPLQALYDRYVDEIETLAEAQGLREDGDKTAARKLETQTLEEMDRIQAELEDELDVDGGGS